METECTRLLEWTIERVLRESKGRALEWVLEDFDRNQVEVSGNETSRNLRGENETRIAALYTARGQAKRQRIDRNAGFLAMTRLPPEK